MRIIVNADDLGASLVVNEQTFALMARGCISSATILANAPAVQDAIRHIPSYDQCSFGVHLNLTEFVPLTPRTQWEGLKPFLDDSGCFAGEERLRSTPIESGAREAFFTEWCLQVRRLLAAGVRVSHFDSHNHVHTVPALFPVLKRVQRQFGVRRVRNSWNVYPPDASTSKLLLLKKRAWRVALQYYYPTATTDLFTSFSTFHSLLTRKSISQVMKSNSMELMVHPGLPAFEQETNLLAGDWMQAITGRTQLISYRDL